MINFIVKHTIKKRLNEIANSVQYYDYRFYLNLLFPNLVPGDSKLHLLKTTENLSIAFFRQHVREAEELRQLTRKQVEQHLQQKRGNTFKIINLTLI